MSIFTDSFETSKREAAAGQYQFVKLFVGDTFTLTLSVPVSHRYETATDKQRKLIESEVLSYLKSFKALLEAGQKISAYQLIHFKKK